MRNSPSLGQRRDVLVVGAGPAGSSAAILLAQAGWRVTLVEQHQFPRQKVCGECVAAGNLSLLAKLGVAHAFAQMAGAELTRVGWMRGDAEVQAEMPACQEGSAPYGRAVGRNLFDAMLLERARAMHVRIVQPAKVRRIIGALGNFRCEIELLRGTRKSTRPLRSTLGPVSVIIDAHGSWETGPVVQGFERAGGRAPHRQDDLFAFKAAFSHSKLAPGFLPVLSVSGGYGGLVVANDHRTTVAVCLRRETLQTLRRRAGGETAGSVVERYLRNSSRGVREALQDSSLETPWLAVGPLRPGVRLLELPGIFSVGNAAGESHPLIGEGISMALQSSKLLADALITHTERVISTSSVAATQRAYAGAWRKAFLPRLRYASWFAQVAMRTPSAIAATASLRAWPALLTHAAWLAGKARRSVDTLNMYEEAL